MFTHLPFASELHKQSAAGLKLSACHFEYAVHKSAENMRAVRCSSTPAFCHAMCAPRFTPVVSQDCCVWSAWHTSKSLDQHWNTQCPRSQPGMQLLLHLRYFMTSSSQRHRAFFQVLSHPSTVLLSRQKHIDESAQYFQELPAQLLIHCILEQTCLVVPSSHKGIFTYPSRPCTQRNITRRRHVVLAQFFLPKHLDVLLSEYISNFF